MPGGIYPSQGKVRIVALVDMAVSSLWLILSFIMLLYVLIKGPQLVPLSGVGQEMVWLTRLILELISELFAWKLLQQSSYPPGLHQNSQRKRAVMWVYAWMMGCIIWVILLSLGAIGLLYSLEIFATFFILIIVLLRVLALKIVNNFVGELQVQEVAKPSFPSRV